MAEGIEEFFRLWEREAGGKCPVSIEEIAEWDYL
jgi:hypothetical protein